jgi:hypothetical protein
VIIRHDRRDRESLVDPGKWPAITSFFRGHGAAMLIASRWLLTAAHVAHYIPADHRVFVELRGQRYAISRVILHPAWQDTWEQEDEDIVGDTVDLAVVELETPVEGVHPFDLYTGSDETGQEALHLAGVSSWQHQGGRPLGLYGCIEHYTRVSRYADWIRETCV